MVCATKPSCRMAVEDAKLWRHGRRSRDWQRNGRRQRLGPRCGRGGDGRRAACRAVRRPRRERRLGPRRGGGNLPAREVLAVFSKPATYPGFADPPKTADQNFVDMAASQQRLRVEERKFPPSIESVQRAAADPTGLAAAVGYKYPHQPVAGCGSGVFCFLFVFPFPCPCSRLGPRSPTQREVRL